jgi:hypothetical protein
VRIEGKVEQPIIPILLCELYKVAQILELNLLKMHSQIEINYDSNSSKEGYKSLSIYQHRSSIHKSNPYEKILNKPTYLSTWKSDENSGTFEVLDIKMNDDSISSNHQLTGQKQGERAPYDDHGISNFLIDSKNHFDIKAQSPIRNSVISLSGQQFFANSEE